MSGRVGGQGGLPNASHALITHLQSTTLPHLPQSAAFPTFPPLRPHPSALPPSHGPQLSPLSVPSHDEQLPPSDLCYGSRERFQEVFTESYFSYMNPFQNTSLAHLCMVSRFTSFSKYVLVPVFIVKGSLSMACPASCSAKHPQHIHPVNSLNYETAVKMLARQPWCMASHQLATLADEALRIHDT